MSLILERASAAQDTLTRLQAVSVEADGEAAHAVAVKQAVLDLAARAELFPLDHYPVKPGTRGGFYRVIEGTGRTNAIYVSVAAPATETERRGNTPHRHVGWATIAGIQGEEFNAIYQRIDDGLVPGQGTLRKRAEVTIREGEAVYVPAGDYHHIELRSANPTLHLHVYQLGVDSPEQAEQPVFLSPESNEYKGGSRPEALRHIAVPVISAAELTDLRRRLTVTVVAVDNADTAILPRGTPAAIAASSTDLSTVSAIPADPQTPVVLLGDIEPVEIVAEQLAHRGVRTLLRLPFKVPA
jgi:predicted metal-dependent enzyme (double-stranded beta helix superfamily)